ncbi:TniQ family protein [Aliarcobacter butzleri]|uniref:TniQ family protein n=1 Tax=Aliarcobacter butzleri TaxID=28197 RepID=A0AAW6VIN5_9BACT|nr:TniQ family protein [Aliarcobacter butzleri]MDK2042372.1 TniQ family protein [Aliarcobacter butzleri]MDK2096698.1 TniQ family protein [Aliarcobacter butzleri]
MVKKKRNNAWVQDYFFLIVPQPLEDELLSSWLTRVAIGHRRQLPIFLTLFAKKEGNQISRTDIDFLYDEKLFEVLVNKSNLTKEDIFKMSLRSEEGYLFSCNNCLYPPLQIRKLTDKRTHNGLMYCPKCLAEDKIAYFRKKWRYQFYNACPKHKVFLTDRCWRCYEKVNFSKIKHNKEICICHKCEKDFRENLVININSNFEYGLKAISWFENGLNDGYFIIDNEKINSLFVFESFTALRSIVDIKDKLNLQDFPLIEEYKTICKKLKKYNSKKNLSMKKEFLLTALVFYLFEKFPNNLLNFVNKNKLTHRDFIHGFKDISFWYKKMIDKIIPMENKIGREINESEVLGAIKYLESIGERINIINVAEVVGCHASIHKGFNKIYKSLVNI